MVTDVTHLFAGFALAGPRLPDVLARPTSWDPASLARGRGDRRADRRRSGGRGPSRPRGCRCSRSTWRRSSRGTPGRRCSTRCAGRGGSAGRLAARSERRGGRSDASDPLFPAVDDVAAARAQGPLRRRDRRRRRPRARDRLRAREARHHATSRSWRRATSAPAVRGRNTTIVRANYRTPEGVAFYKEALRLYEQLAQELDYNLLFSQQGHLTLAHAERAVNVAHERAEVNRLLGVDSPGDLPGRDRESSVRSSTCPTIPTFPIMAALYHPPGGVIRHDAVVWAYARQADRMGVHIHQGTEVTGIDVEGGRVTGVRTNARGHLDAASWSRPSAGWTSRDRADGGRRRRRS